MGTADYITVNLINELQKRCGIDTIILPRVHVGTWECDLLAYNSRDYSTEYEIKTSKSDFIKDFDKRCYKWDKMGKYSDLTYKHDILLYGNRVNKFCFVIPAEFLKDENLMLQIDEKYGIITYIISNNKIKFNFYREAKFLNKLQNRWITRNKLNKLLLAKYHYLYAKLFKRSYYESKEKRNI